MSPLTRTHVVSLFLALGVVGPMSLAWAQDTPPPPPSTKAPPGRPPSYPPSYRPGYPPGYPPIGTKAPATRPPSRAADSDSSSSSSSSASSRRAPPAPSRPGVDSAGDQGNEPGQLSEFETGIEFRRQSGLVTFNFEDADLPDLVRTITAITGRRFIIGGKVRSIKATIYAPTKVRPAEAYRAFLSALEANGLTVVPAGRYLKIIELSGSSSTPLPVYRDGEVVPAEERMVTRLHRLGHVGAEDISEVLGRFKSRDGDVTVYAPTNTLIITDTGSNVRRLLQLVEALDVAASGEQIWVEPIHHAAASDLAEKLLEIFEAAGGGGAAPTKARAAPRRPPTKGTSGSSASSGPTTIGTGQSESRLSKIIPDDRTNSLIIVATERAYLRILELIRRLDVPLAGEGEIHVEYLQNADAEELAGVIQSIVGGGRGGGGASATRRRGASGGSSSSSRSSGAAPTDTDVFEGNVQVVADKATNSLVILSSLRDYTSLRAVIQRLDIPRRQVFVEAALMEVSQSRLNTLGLAFHGGLPVDVNLDGTTGDPAIGFTGTAYPAGSLPFSSVAIDPTALTGLAAGLLGPQIEGSEQVLGFSLPAFGIVLQALQTNNDVNVISTPHILATDNVEAQITVGQNVPVQQGFAGLAGAAGQAGNQNLAGLAGLLPQVNVQRQNVGLTLKLTPHVNESQQVRLELSVELSEVQGASSIHPTISQRTVNTQVVVRDQQTIVIGGLVRDVEAETVDKVPVLGDIPILGYLFRRTQSRREKQNLLIILTPYIIRDVTDLRAIFQRKLEERREFIERYTAFANRDPNLHVDYSRTNGLLEEINQVYQEAMHEDQLLRDAAARVPAEHVPGQPIELPRSGNNGGGEGDDDGGEGEDDSSGDSNSGDGVPPPPTVDAGTGD